LQRLQAHPAKASYANQLLDNANFVDAYKNLGYLESKYGDFLKSLRENPRLVASSLAFVDQFKINIDTKQVARLLLNSLYGFSRAHDESCLLWYVSVYDSMHCQTGSTQPCSHCL